MDPQTQCKALHSACQLKTLLFCLYLIQLKKRMWNINCKASQWWSIGQLWWVIYNQSNFYRFEETSSYWSFQFFSSAFHRSPSISKPCMSLLFFFKPMEPDKVSSVTIIWQTSYDSRPQNQMRFADESYEVCQLGQLYQHGQKGGPNYRIGSDCLGHA